MGDSPDYLKHVQDTICTCGVCHKPCQHPRALPCLHVACFDCLQTYVKDQVNESGKGYFPCPTCKQPTDLPKNVHQLGKVADFFDPDTFVGKLGHVISTYAPDKPCDLCDVTSASASGWCMECYQAICDACTSLHLRHSSSAEHTVVSVTDMRSLPLENVMKRERPVPCTEHAPEVLAHFCQDCKEAACPECLRLRHRKCGSCVTVNDAMAAKEEDLAELVIRLQALPTAEAGLSGGFGDAMEVLEETVRSSRERIRSIAADVKKKVEESEQSLLKELEETHKMLKEKVEGEGGPGKDHSKTLRAADDRMQFLLKYGSDVEILQTYHTVKDAMTKMEGPASVNGVGEEGAEEDLMFRVTFMPDDPVKLFQRDYETLGHIQVEDCNSDDGLSSWGVTCTSRDEIIVVDCRNKRMQKFTSNGDLIDHIQISEEPRDVTSCGADDVAITIMKRQIFIVTVTGNMALKSRIRTQKQYDAISSSSTDKTFLVSCLLDTSVDVITFSGDVVKSFNVDPSGSAIFLTPRYVTFSQEGNYVISDVASNAVKSISPEGALLFTYHPSGAHVLRKPQGLCIDNIGNVFIADYGNSRIQLITNEGAFQRFVLARESGIQRPVAIHMTASSKLIVVQSDGMVKVFSYE